MHRAIVGALFLLTSTAVPASASAGVVIQLEQPGGVTTLTAQGKKLRIERQGPQAHVVIFDGDKQEMYELDPAKHTYAVITQADAKDLAAQIDAMLAKLPPEQRAKAEAAMKDRRAQAEGLADIKYEPTGKRDVVAGYPCDQYRVVRGNGHNEEACFIPWGPKTVTKQDLGALVDFAKFMDRFMSAATGVRQGGSGINVADQIDRAPGFPGIVERQTGDEKKPMDTERLLSLAHTTVGPNEFAVPAGYSKVEKPKLGAGAPPARSK